MTKRLPPFVRLIREKQAQLARLQRELDDVRRVLNEEEQRVVDADAPAPNPSSLGRAGGLARAKALTAAQRTAIARKAAAGDPWLRRSRHWRMSMFSVR